MTEREWPGEAEEPAEEQAESLENDGTPGVGETAVQDPDISHGEAEESDIQTPGGTQVHHAESESTEVDLPDNEGA